MSREASSVCHTDTDQEDTDDGIHEQPRWAKGRLTLSLWFDDDAEQAWALYSSCSPTPSCSTWIASDPTRRDRRTASTAMGWNLNGLDIMAINGGPMYPLTPAVSLVVPCTTQAEIDRCWDRPHPRAAR